MNRLFQNSSQIQVFEWTILLVALGIIVVAVHQNIGVGLSPGMPEGEVLAGSSPDFLTPSETSGMHELAEQALLAELSLAYSGNGHASNWLSVTDWPSFGISPDEQTFFTAWRGLQPDISLSADEWLEQLQEAHNLYLNMGDILAKRLSEDTLFVEVGRLYQIPVDVVRMHKVEDAPATPGQWAFFVAQYQRKER